MQNQLECQPEHAAVHANLLRPLRCWHSSHIQTLSNPAVMMLREDTR